MTSAAHLFVRGLSPQIPRADLRLHLRRGGGLPQATNTVKAGRNIPVIHCGSYIYSKYVLLLHVTGDTSSAQVIDSGDRKLTRLPAVTSLC
jgi:hypothetical protein